MLVAYCNITCYVTSIANQVQRMRIVESDTLVQNGCHLRSFPPASSSSRLLSSSKSEERPGQYGVERSDERVASTVARQISDADTMTLAQLDVGDAFGGGELLHAADDVPEHLGVRAVTALKLYTTSAAALHKRGDASLVQQLSNEVRV